MTDAVETITLKQPIEITLKRAGQDERSETFKELPFHPFKAKDLRAIDGIPADNHGSMAIALMARMTRTPIIVIDELGAEDFQTLSARVEAFLPSGRPTGATG